MIFNINNDPYDTGVALYKTNSMEFKPGITVLVGCNGIGKTSLLINIKEEAHEQNIPCHLFNNLSDGGSSSISSLLSGFCPEKDDFSMGIALYSSSEGEAIKLNIGRQSRLYRGFLKSGQFRDKYYSISKAFSRKDDNEPISDKRRILLFDAVDSGLSVDSVCEIKDLFELIKQDAEQLGVELYIIISANEYELCINQNCFDTTNGVYTTFPDYNSYRSFILKSRKEKEKRLQKQDKVRERRKLKEQKEYEKLKESVLSKIEAIKNGSDNLTWSQQREIHDLKDRLNSFVRRANYNDFETI